LTASPVRRIVAEGVGIALLLATVVGSGILTFAGGASSLRKSATSGPVRRSR